MYVDERQYICTLGDRWCAECVCTLCVRWLTLSMCRTGWHKTLFSRVRIFIGHTKRCLFFFSRPDVFRTNRHTNKQTNKQNAIRSRATAPSCRPRAPYDGIGKRLAEKCLRDTADLRKDIRFILEWHLRYIVGRQAYNNIMGGIVKRYAWYTWKTPTIVFLERVQVSHVSPPDSRGGVLYEKSWTVTFHCKGSSLSTT